MDQSKSWTNSIDLLADYSAGQSLIPYTKLWDLKPSKRTESEYSIRFEVNLGTVQHVTVSVAGSYETMIARLLGYMLVSSLPEEGLTEALECLRDTWNFHTEGLKHIHSPLQLSQKVAPQVLSKDTRPGLALLK
jgi:hypothetical protein